MIPLDTRLKSGLLWAFQDVWSPALHPRGLDHCSFSLSSVHDIYHLCMWPLVDCLSSPPGYGVHEGSGAALAGKGRPHVCELCGGHWGMGGFVQGRKMKAGMSGGRLGSRERQRCGGRSREGTSGGKEEAGESGGLPLCSSGQGFELPVQGALV